MKIAYISCLAIFALSALLSILQMWFEVFHWDVFFRFLITLGLLFSVVLGVALARREYLSDNKLREDGYID